MQELNSDRAGPEEDWNGAIGDILVECAVGALMTLWAGIFHGRALIPKAPLAGTDTPLAGTRVRGT